MLLQHPRASEREVGGGLRSFERQRLGAPGARSGGRARRRRARRRTAATHSEEEGRAGSEWLPKGSPHGAIGNVERIQR
eukprot:8271919-Pyramimonas_sp.AAC.1